MLTPPEGFPLQFGTGIIKVNDEGKIVDALYYAPTYGVVKDDFHFIIANVSNFDIMNCIGGTIELINFKPTIKFPDGSSQTPPPPEPIQPPTLEERLSMMEGTVMDMMMKEMMMNG